MKWVAAIAVAMATASCVHSSGPLPVVSPASPATVLEQLRAIRSEFGGARGLLKVRLSSGSTGQSFSARFRADRDGRLQIDALTPFGTTAFSIFASGREAVVVDQLNGTYWTGSLAGLGGILPVFGFGLEAREIASLLLGLPPDDTGLLTPSSGSGRAGSQGNYRFELLAGEQGLEAVTLVERSPAARIDGRPLMRVTYRPAVFPPRLLTIQSETPDGGFELSARFVELDSWNGTLISPDVAGLRCCELPSSGSRR